MVAYIPSCLLLKEYEPCGHKWEGKMNFSPSCTHNYLSRGMILLLTQVSPDVHVKCKEINRPAFPKELVWF